MKTELFKNADITASIYYLLEHVLSSSGITQAESRKHYGRTVIDRRKVCKTMEIWRKVCQNRDLDEGLDKHFNNKNWDKLLEETVICN